MFLSLNPRPWVLQAFTLDNYAGLGISLRLDIWSRAWAMLKDMPLTGIGLNNFPIQIGVFYPGYAIGNEPHAHQLYLQTALDLGLPGLLAFVWALTLWFRRLSENFRQTQDRLARALYLGLAAGVIAYLAHGFLDALMLGAKPGVLLWVMLGLGAARPAVMPGELPRVGGGKLRWVWASFGPYFALLLGFAFLAIYHPALLEMNIATLQAHRVLLQPPGGDLQATPDLAAVTETLQRVAALDPKNRTANELAGRLLLRQADPQTALQYFYQVVNLDRLNPYKEFYPPAYLTGRLLGQEQSYVEGLQDLAAVYDRWTQRYPGQTSYYLLAAILYNQYLGNPAQARRVLERGLAHPALPQGALEYYRDQLSP